MGSIVGGALRLLAVMALVLSTSALAGCGGGGADRAGAAEERARKESPSATTAAARSSEGKGPGAAVGNKKGTATTTTVAGGAGPKAAGGGKGGGGEEVDTTTLTMEISVTLVERCVRPGGTQTITVHAPYTSTVGYDTYYADGKSSLHEGFHGGNFVGWTDESDTWTHTWTVAATAPPGQATVVVMAIHDEYGRGETGDLFVVADPLGLCDPPRYANE